jgi:hypothetical protein
MAATITTEVFTLDELVDRGDEGAVDRALTWMREAWDDVAVERVSEDVTDALRAANLSGLTITGWDYWRGNVDIEGEVTAHELASVPPGHFLGRVKFPHVEWIERVSFGTRRAMDCGHDVWIDMAEDAPFGWASDKYADLIADAIDWQRGIESGLAHWMTGAYEAWTSRAYLLDVAEANEYTFTADGERFG